MRKIIVLSMITMDGVMQAPGGPDEDTSGGFKFGGWTAPYQDEVGNRFLQEALEQNADYLLGRKTYEIWADYWPQHAEFWPGINTGVKYVLSNTIKNSDWEHTVFIGDLAAIQKLRDSDGPVVQVWGSSKLIQLLLENDLVDELRLLIYPVVLGAGKRLFAANAFPSAFKLTESLTTPSGVIIASYKRGGEVKTGTVGA